MKKILSMIEVLGIVFIALFTLACQDTSTTITGELTLNLTSRTLVVGNSFTLIADGPEDVTVTFSSSNDNIASVTDEGVVTGVAVGVATITAAAGDLTATCSVSVVNEDDVNQIDLSFDYYEKTQLREDKKIYVLNDPDIETLDEDDLFTAQALQGLFARYEVTFYVDSRYMTNGTNIDMYYLEEAVENYDLVVESITLAEAIQMYIDVWSENVNSGVWGSNIDLSDYNNIVGVTAYTETSGDGYSTPGFIIYKKAQVSVNVAATLAGITGFIPVELSKVEQYESYGLVEKFNLDSSALNNNWLFGVAFEEINPDGLIHQNYTDGNGNTNKFIKDYGIANKYMYVYYDGTITSSAKVKFHNFLTKNRPIFGYTYSEDNDVAFFSEYGQFIVPTDYTCNLTFLVAEEFDDTDVYSQPNTDTTEVDSNKHYVAFVVSDGDNATYWQNTAAFATNYMAAIGREEDTFPVTWSITPSLADLMPLVLSNVYDTATDYDYFAAPVSGQGYINTGEFASVDNGVYWQDFLEKLNIYLTKADLSAVTVIGANSGTYGMTNILDDYAQLSAVSGGIVYDGNKYFSNVEGGVYWSNGKPFIGPRDSLWETTPAYIAARINMYPTDPTTVDGYTVINVHPWSHSYDDIRTIVSQLDDDVEVVSLDRLIELMTENVTDKTNTATGAYYNIPDLNGVTITESYLQSNPSLIPVDPLYNDFLLWAEDWSGSGVTYQSSDSSVSNVGAIFKTNIEIDPGTTAVKDTFTLPNYDDIWVSFMARANSINTSDTATFSFSMTVDGVTKTIIASATMIGVSGTETESVTGDGWQVFAFPLSQYFENAAGKEASMSITVDSGGKSIKLDQVTVTYRALESTAYTVDPYHNEFNDGNTEDWMLGDQYKTSQYYHWAAYDRETLEYTGTIQIDCSDGGGDEKRNGNTNVWMAKTYVLPDSDNITISWSAQSRAESKVTLYIDGNALVLFEFAAMSLSETYSYNLQELFPTIDFAGKEVTVVWQTRDSGENNGVGEDCSIYYFYTDAE